MTLNISRQGEIEGVSCCRDDYNKKVEECSRLLQRHEDLEDKYTQLKQASSAEVQDLQRRLTDALESEKVPLQNEKITKKNEIEISFLHSIVSINECILQSKKFPAVEWFKKKGVLCCGFLRIKF